jgi:hypothetical protein
MGFGIGEDSVAPTSTAETSTDTTAGERTGTFTRTHDAETPLTEQQRTNIVDTWSAAAGYKKIVLPDGTPGFQGPDGNLLRANGLPYVAETHFPIGVVAVVTMVLTVGLLYAITPRR